MPGLIVTGGQYGSEGKGAFVHWIGKSYSHQVRVGGPQAGHSVKMKDGRVLKFQSLPVGSLHRGTVNLIAMASVVDPLQVEMEMEWVMEVTGRRPVVIVDPRATYLDDSHASAERSDGMWERLGSTAHGVGAARVARIWRTAQTVGDAPTRLPDDVLIENTTEVIAQALHAGEGVMVEGAQGHHLSLYSGGFYPFCTSGECGPTQAFADMGLPLDAAGEFETAAVFRTFPIRVAGNSGPLTGETSWEALRRTYGEHIPVEQTTVTARVRRVGAFDPALARRSVMENGIHWAVLSFLDYPFPEVAGVTAWENLTAEARRLTLVREQQLGIPIRYVATGFGTFAEVPHRVGATA